VLKRELGPVSFSKVKGKREGGGLPEKRIDPTTLEKDVSSFQLEEQ